MAARPLIACPDCDTLHERVALERGGQAHCRCCGSVLYRRGRFSPEQWIALSWTCLIVFAVAQLFPIVHLSVRGLDASVTFWGALRLCWDRGFYGVSILAGLVGFWFPLVRITLTLWALQAIVARRLPPGFVSALRLMRRLDHWAMATVLMLAILVALVKLGALARVQIAPGLPAFMVLTFLLAGLSRWDVRALWRHAEDAGLVRVSGRDGTGCVCDGCGLVQALPADGRCQRCHVRLHRRRTTRASEVWAPLLAAAVFYLPANVLPVMHIQSVVGDSDHTILGGVVELWQSGAPDLAVIVFVASVLVPVTKLMVLALFLLRPAAAEVNALRHRTRLYGVIEFVGPWSMLDVFVVVLLAAMADFPGLTQISVGPAALSFGLVVVLTMWAAMRYDPRLDWDRLRKLHRG